jgi:hypothetical protein
MKTSKNACIIRSEFTHYAYILLCKQTFQIRSVPVQLFRFSSYLLRKPHLFVILTAIGWFIVNIQSDLFWHRCLERQTFGTPRMYAKNHFLFVLFYNKHNYWMVPKNGKHWHATTHVLHDYFISHLLLTRHCSLHLFWRGKQIMWQYQISFDIDA